MIPFNFRSGGGKSCTVPVAAVYCLQLEEMDGYPEIGDAPFQPRSHDYPKRAFGVSQVVFRRNLVDGLSTLVQVPCLHRQCGVSSACIFLFLILFCSINIRPFRPNFLKTFPGDDPWTPLSWSFAAPMLNCFRRPCIQRARSENLRDTSWVLQPRVTATLSKPAVNTCNQLWKRTSTFSNMISLSQCLSCRHVVQALSEVSRDDSRLLEYRHQQEEIRHEANQIQNNSLF